MNKTCSFTGHRQLPINKINNITQALSLAIDTAIDNGCTHFISGGARGTDILSARLVTEKIDCNESISLSLYLPHENFTNEYDMAYFRPYCNKITYISPNYNISNYIIRDKKMVEASDMIICLYDGRESGGTYQTIKFAKQKNIEILIIDINNIPEDDI